MQTELQDQELDQDLPRYCYAGNPGELCLACGGLLSDKGFCLNPICPFLLSDDVQNVVRALIADGKDQYEAIAIASTYTLDPEAEVAVKERFKVVDMSSADWVLKKMAQAQHMLDSVRAMEAQRIAEIHQQVEKIAKPYMQQLEYFQAAYGEHLREWATKERPNIKGKTIKLINGALSFRTGGTKLVIDDESAAIILAKVLEIPDAVVETQSLSKSAVTKWLKDQEQESLIFEDPFAENTETVVAHLETDPEKFEIKPTFIGGGINA